MGRDSSFDHETIEEQLVRAARTQLATSRQQLLATMVVMGIKRIVVTDDDPWSRQAARERRP